MSTTIQNPTLAKLIELFTIALHAINPNVAIAHDVDSAVEFQVYIVDGVGVYHSEGTYSVWIGEGDEVLSTKNVIEAVRAAGLELAKIAIDAAFSNAADPSDVLTIEDEAALMGAREPHDEGWTMVEGEECPGCHAQPGDGLTEGCNHPDGCGFWRQFVGDTAEADLAFDAARERSYR
jgi:hypothetical protein